MLICIILLIGFVKSGDFHFGFGFQVEAKEVVLHDIDVPNAVADYVLRHCIGSLVVGASHRNAITRSLFPSLHVLCVFIVNKLEAGVQYINSCSAFVFLKHQLLYCNAENLNRPMFHLS